MSNKTDLIDHNFLENIDTENKSYLLGWIAACQSIVENKIAIETNKTNLEFFKIVRDIVSHDIPIINDGNLISFTIISTKMTDDVINHLKWPLSFPLSIKDELKWDFVRGYFDCSGFFSIKDGHIICLIGSYHLSMIEELHNFCGGKAQIHNGEVCEWKDENALKLLSRIYNNAKIFLPQKRDAFISLANAYGYPPFPVV